MLRSKVLCKKLPGGTVRLHSVDLVLALLVQMLTVLPFLVLALTHRSQQKQQAIRDMVGADEENSCAVECDDEACEDYSIDSEQCDVCKRLCRAGETPLTAEPQLKGRGAVIF